jgi:hypothetical protein
MDRVFVCMDGGLRKLFRKYVQPCDWQSIETAMTGGGVPDSNYCMGGVEGWIEFKLAHHWQVPLRPEQIGWILRRSRFGGRVFIAVRRQSADGPRRGPAVDELWLLAGRYAKEARMDGMKHIPPEAILGRWMGGPGGWAWGEVSRCLMGAH